ncbi:MAG: hypothetical protein BWK76_16375 [Desulfobulbaceae bacterium A2]|nr:MAG: hypothetical protein BWK76_16375 [Desulfobulbaceae bacterium A2]
MQFQAAQGLHRRDVGQMARGQGDEQGGPALTLDDGTGMVFCRLDVHGRQQQQPAQQAKDMATENQH